VTCAQIDYPVRVCACTVPFETEGVSSIQRRSIGVSLFVNGLRLRSTILPRWHSSAPEPKPLDDLVQIQPLESR